MSATESGISYSLVKAAMRLLCRREVREWQLGSKYCVDKIPNKHVSDKKTAEEGKGGDGTGRFPSRDGGGGDPDIQVTPPHHAGHWSPARQSVNKLWTTMLLAGRHCCCRASHLRQVLSSSSAARPAPPRQPGTQTIFTTTNNTQTGAGPSQPPQICSYWSHAPWRSCGQRIMIFNGTCYSMIGVQCSAK